MILLIKDFSPIDDNLLTHPFGLVCIGIIIIWFIFSVKNHTPKYYEDTGARQQSAWTSSDSRARRQRHYNRRKAEECEANGESLKAEYYWERYENSWAEVPYVKDNFKSWLDRKEKGITIEQQGHFEILDELMRGQLQDQYKVITKALKKDPNTEITLDITWIGETDDVDLVEHKETFDTYFSEWIILFNKIKG